MVEKTRLIYTAGTFQVTDELAQCKRLLITASVLRKPPTQEYQNERSNPPKGFLGYVGIFTNSYCLKILPLEFDPQLILFWDNPAIQLYYSLLCTGANIVDTIVALGASMTPPAILIPTTPEPEPFQGCPFTILKFKLLFGTRIEVRAVGEEVVSCAGIDVEATIPDLDPPPAPYPPEQPRDEDPPRSPPEPDELPGDTAPVTPEDPESDGSPTVGTWLLTWTQSSGINASAEYPGVSTDTWAIVPGSPSCGLSGASRLIKNGTDVVVDPFNCNSAGFVSVLVSAVFS